MHAFVTVWPSMVEFRDETGAFGSQPLTEDRIVGLGTLFALLIDRGVDNIEVRVENTDD